MYSEGLLSNARCCYAIAHVEMKRKKINESRPTHPGSPESQARMSVQIRCRTQTPQTQTQTRMNRTRHHGYRCIANLNADYKHTYASRQSHDQYTRQLYTPFPDERDQDKAEADTPTSLMQQPQQLSAPPPRSDSPTRPPHSSPPNSPKAPSSRESSAAHPAHQRSAPP